MTYKTLIQKREYMQRWQEKNREHIRKKNLAWYYKNKEAVLARQKQKNIENPEKRYLINRKSDLRKYGITIELYDKLEKKQKGVCAICKTKCKTGRKLAVDHCHKTNKIRGLLCANCNRGLGYFNDNKKLLISATKYICT